MIKSPSVNSGLFQSRSPEMGVTNSDVMRSVGTDYVKLRGRGSKDLRRSLSDLIDSGKEEFAQSPAFTK